MRVNLLLDTHTLIEQERMHVHASTSHISIEVPHVLHNTLVALPSTLLTSPSTPHRARICKEFATVTTKETMLIVWSMAVSTRSRCVSAMRRRAHISTLLTASCITANLRFSKRFEPKPGRIIKQKYMLMAMMQEKQKENWPHRKHVTRGGFCPATPRKAA